MVVSSMFHCIEILIDSLREMLTAVLHDGLSEGKNDLGAKCYSFLFYYSSNAKPFQMII